MAKFYYNGVLLPEIPADVLAEYPYAVMIKTISESDETQMYVFMCAKVPLYVNTMREPSSLSPITSTDISIYSLQSEIWTLGAEYSNSTAGIPAEGSVDGGYTYETIWTTHDLYSGVSSGSANTLYLAASEPIPEDEYNPGGGDSSVLFDDDITTVDGIYDFSTRKIVTDATEFSVIFNGEEYNVTPEIITIQGEEGYVLGNKRIYIDLMLKFTGLTLEELLTSDPTMEVFNEDTGENFAILCKIEGDTMPQFVTILDDGTYRLTISKSTGSNTGSGEDSDIQQVYLRKTLLTNIADAIREKTGKTDKMYLSQMPEEIEGIVGKSLLADVIEGDEPVAVSSELVTDIGSYAFYWHSGITSVDFPNCETVGKEAFRLCASLTSVSFPACTTLDVSAFAQCSVLTSVDFPACITIANMGFYGCTSLTEANFPVCTTIQSSTFLGCNKLTSVSFPVCETIGNFAFSMCTSLESADFPNCTTIGSSAFNKCSKITTANFPACTTINNMAFCSCSKLISINFPNCTTIGENAFYSCSSLTEANFPACEMIRYQAFMGCFSLTSLTFGASSIVTLSQSNAFYSTPMSNSTLTGSFGSIYVPASLVDSYKAASNWSYFADRITAIVE